MARPCRYNGLLKIEWDCKPTWWRVTGGPRREQKHNFEADTSLIYENEKKKPWDGCPPSQKTAESESAVLQLEIKYKCNCSKFLQTSRFEKFLDQWFQHKSAPVTCTGQGKVLTSKPECILSPADDLLKTCIFPEHIYFASWDTDVRAHAGFLTIDSSHMTSALNSILCLHSIDSFVSC